tara:strand:+ start:426 stop:788 length:363 start_codon:yes stop_codon:yes gene_type:complete
MKKVLLVLSVVALTFSMNAQEQYSGKIPGIPTKTYFTFVDDIIIVEAKGKYKSIDTVKAVRREVKGVVIYNVTEGALHPTRYILYKKTPLMSSPMLNYAQKDDFTGVVTTFNYKLTKLTR